MRDNGILVIVHPGSACGSADYNLGRDYARGERAMLAQEINAWHGPVIVLDGDLSDELPDYPDLANAILDALARAEAAGLFAVREEASDPEQVEAIARIVKRLDVSLKTRFTVTGAWASHGTEGCVNSVHDALAEIGMRSEISESAVFVAEDPEDGEEGDEDDGGGGEESQAA